MILRVTLCGGETILVVLLLVIADVSGMTLLFFMMTFGRTPQSQLNSPIYILFSTFASVLIFSPNRHSVSPVLVTLLTGGEAGSGQFPV